MDDSKKSTSIHDSSKLSCPNEKPEEKMAHSGFGTFIAKCLALLLIGLIVLSGINYLVIGSTTSFTRNTMSDLYAQEQVDLVFLGTSTTFVSCNPEIFDAQMNLNTLNGATPEQNLLDSYTQLKEVFRLYQPDYVVLGIGPQRLVQEGEPNDLSSSYLFDNMQWSPVRAEYLAAAFEPDYYPSALFPVVRLRSELSMDDISLAVQSRTAQLQGTQIEQEGTPNLIYYHKGFIQNKARIDNLMFPSYQQISFMGEESVSPFAAEQLASIAQLCRENDSTLIIFQPALVPGATGIVSDYRAYHNYLASFAHEEGAVFVDFNCLDREVFTFDQSMFSDLIHITDEYADEFSTVFAEMLTTYRNRGEAALQANFVPFEELQDQQAVATVWIEEASDTETHARAIGVGKIEYRYFITTDDEAQELMHMQDWSGQQSFMYPALPPGEYMVIVHARTAGSEANFDRLGIMPVRVD